MVKDDVFPAYRKFAEFLRTDYDPKGRTELSIESLPDGKRRYAEAVKMMTTMNVTPAEVHEIGLKEVERITAEMTKLAQAQGKKDLASFREAINNDPKWKPQSEQQIVDDFAKYIHQMEPKLPELFGLLPKSPVTVEPIPDFAKAEATHYVAGTPDGKRPGRVVVAVADPTKRTLINGRSRCLSRRRSRSSHADQHRPDFEGLPKFRLHGFYSAYAEGWALYSEELGKGDRLLQGPCVRLWPAELRAVSRRSAGGRYGHSRQELEPREGDRVHARQRRERRAGADRGGPLHRLAGAGAGLQDGPAHHSQAARRSQGAARLEVRHQSLPRRNPERRIHAVRSPPGARAAMDQITVACARELQRWVEQKARVCSEVLNGLLKSRLRCSVFKRYT